MMSRVGGEATNRVYAIVPSIDWLAEIRKDTARGELVHRDPVGGIHDCDTSCC